MSTPLITPNLLAQMRAAQSPMPALPAGPVMPSAMSLPVPASPLVSQAAHVPTQMERDQTELDRRVNTGSGIDQIHNPLLRGLARTADIAGSVFGAITPVGRVLDMAIPGTTLHHQVLVAQKRQDLANDQATQKAADESAQQQANTGLTDANTDYAKQRPAIESAKIQQKRDIANNKNAATLAPHGFIYGTDPETGEPTITEDTNSQAYRDRQTLTAMHQATADKDQIMAEIAQNHYQPGTPEYAEAQRKLAQVDARLHVAVAGLGLRAQGLELRKENQAAGNYGTDLQGNALPGAMATEDGRSVGSKFQGNVRPTGQERNKADMAFSAEEQLTDIKSIMQRHPGLFGPGYGQASAFRQWLGSEDPDAQRFIAARTIAGDHLAGTFGGRSEAALDALDKAIGQFKDNPKAAIAGIDQLTKANTRFEKAGTVRTAGSQTAGVPKAGDVVDGYKFKGGNPSDQKNWEKQ